MSRIKSRIGLILSFSIIIGFFLSPTYVQGQSIWLPRNEGNNISLEVFKSDYDTDFSLSVGNFTTSVWFLTGQIELNPRLAIVSELSISRFVYGRSQTIVGNPYIGLLFNPTAEGVTGELGVRLPITSDENFLASINGWYSEFDRFEAFVPDLLTIQGRFGETFFSSDEKIRARLLAGGTIWVPTRSGSDPEGFADGIAQIWYEDSQYILGATLSAHTLLSEKGASFKQRSEFQFGVGATGIFGNVRPSVHVHIPLTETGLIGVGRAVKAVFGLNISILFGEVDDYDSYDGY